MLRLAPPWPSSAGTGLPTLTGHRQELPALLCSPVHTLSSWTQPTACSSPLSAHVLSRRTRQRPFLNKEMANSLGTGLPEPLGRWESSRAWASRRGSKLVMTGSPGEQSKALLWAAVELSYQRKEGQSRTTWSPPLPLNPFTRQPQPLADAISAPLL